MTALRPLFASVLPFVLVVAACPSPPVGGAEATKPQSPAEGAGDYNEQNIENASGGPGDQAPPSGEGSASTDTKGKPEAPECPPTCSATGEWIGCGLKKPRGTGCDKCSAPKCKEGTWYDCNGVMIVQHACS